MSEDTGGCIGLCCTNLPLSVPGTTHEEQLSYLLRMAESGTKPESWSVEDLDRNVAELRYIHDMLIPLPDRRSDGRPAFGCVLFDVDTMLCTAYSSRPKMCSDYPAYVGKGYSGERGVCSYRDRGCTYGI